MTTESTSADDAARRDGSRLSEGLGLAPERAALPNRWRVVCTPGAEPYFERHAEGAWAQRERVDAEIAAAVAAERGRWVKALEKHAVTATQVDCLGLLGLVASMSGPNVQANLTKGAADEA